jgi:hypothetical protein
MIAAAGSPFGTRGISTMPAPRRPRALRIDDEPVRAVRADGVRPDGAECRGAVAAETDCAAADWAPAGWAAVGCATDWAAGWVAAAGAGAVPQTSQ